MSQTHDLQSDDSDNGLEMYKPKKRAFQNVKSSDGLYPAKSQKRSAKDESDDGERKSKVCSIEKNNFTNMKKKRRKLSECTESDPEPDINDTFKPWIGRSKNGKLVSNNSLVFIIKLQTFNLFVLDIYIRIFNKFFRFSWCT